MGLCLGLVSMEMLRVGVASGFPQKSSFCVVDGVEYVGYVYVCGGGCVCTHLRICMCGMCSCVGWSCVCLCVDGYLHIL